jgi:flagellin-like hook-associated protein FlgL
MILTDTTALGAQLQYTKSQANFNAATRRISSGTKILGSQSDAGSLSQAESIRSEKRLGQSYKIGLQNTLSFLHAQEEGIGKVVRIYDRIEELSLRSMDPTASNVDREDYNNEFDALASKLENLMKTKFQGRSLFSPTMTSGEAKEIPIQNAFDLSNKANKNGAAHVVVAQSVDIGTNAGTISFRVNSGTDGDSYRVWLGDVCVFSAGSEYRGPTNDLGPHYDPNNFDFEDQGWRTSGSANDGNEDLIEVTFQPGMETTFKITPGSSNDNNADGISNFNNMVNGEYHNVYTNPVPPNFSSNRLTLQIETDSIGIIYKKDHTASGYSQGSGQGIEFTPIFPPLEVETASSGETVKISQKGFSYFDEKSDQTGDFYGLDTLTKASDTLDYLRGNNEYYGETKWVIEDHLSSIAIEQKRIEDEIERIEQKEIHTESTLSQILDADIAYEATQIAQSELKANAAASCITKSIQINDSLISLTTNHHRGQILKS